MDDINKLFVQLGFIQGDGCTGRLKSDEHLGLEINIGINDLEIFTLFNIDRVENKRAYYHRGFNDICRELKFSSEQLPNRPLPLTYNDWSDYERLSFLRGLYSANGCFIKKGRISFKTTCKELSHQLKEALIYFGFNPYITTNKPKSVKFKNGDYTCKESYDINIGRQLEVKRFYDMIGFLQQYKMDNVLEFLQFKNLTNPQ